MDQFQQLVILNVKAMISIQIHLKTAVQTIFPHGWCSQALSLGRDHRAGSGMPTACQTTTQNAKLQIAPFKKFAGDLHELGASCKVEPHLQKKALDHEKKTG